MSGTVILTQARLIIPRGRPGEKDRVFHGCAPNLGERRVTYFQRNCLDDVTFARRGHLRRRSANVDTLGLGSAQGNLRRRRNTAAKRRDLSILGEHLKG